MGLRRIRRTALLLGTLIVATLSTGALYQQWATSRDAQRFPPPGELIDIGGRKLHLLCRGAGAPTVVLETSGLGTVTQYQSVQDALAATNKVCSYDRAGLGWSEPGDRPATARHLEDDLQSLLRVAKIPPPYLFVASSAGGLTVELFTRDHNDEVVGLVWVDALAGEIVDALPEIEVLQKPACQAAQWSWTGLVRWQDPLRLRAVDNPERQRAAALTYRTSAFNTVCSLTKSFRVSAAEIHAAPKMSPSLPIVVLVHGEPRDLLPDANEAQLAAFEPKWRAAQRSFVQRFTAGRLVIAQHTGHLIASENPQLVVDSVRQVLRTANEKPAAQPTSGPEKSEKSSPP